MTQASPEGNFSSREDTLLKNTNEITTSDVIILGSDTASLPPSIKMQKAREYASRESDNFTAIDQQVDGFIGVLGKDLSEVQAATTDPAILIRQAEHVMEASDHLIDGGINSKVAIRERNQENLGKMVTGGVARGDLTAEISQRHKHIVEVLLANRSAREGLLQEQVHKLEVSIEEFRQYLSEADPSQLVAFDAHFNREVKTNVPEAEVYDVSNAIVTPSVAELEEHIGLLTDETVSPSRGINLLGLKALEKVFTNTFRKSKTPL